MGFIKTIKDIIFPLNKRSFKREITKLKNKLEYDMQRQESHLRQRVDAIYKKLSMPDNIWQVKDVRFYVPNYPNDGIQRIIVDQEEFYEQDILQELSLILPKNAVILDIGANIGNHSLYWLSQNEAKQIYCFEPRPETYQILAKNIEINNFNDKVELYDCALSEKEGSLSTKFFQQKNIGANSYIEDEKGKTKSRPLDSIHFTEKIDFIKIDVEGMEGHVLKGAKETIRKNKPLIFIEVFDENLYEIDALLTELGYERLKEFRASNYLYASRSKSI